MGKRDQDLRRPLGNRFLRKDYLKYTKQMRVIVSSKLITTQIYETCRYLTLPQPCIADQPPVQPMLYIMTAVEKHLNAIYQLNTPEKSKAKITIRFFHRRNYTLSYLYSYQIAFVT